jgi:hypothetical protein
MSATMNDEPVFVQVTGEINHEIFAPLSTGGLNYFSCIFQAFNNADEPVDFPAVPVYQYHVQVSNDAYDESREGDLYSYYNVYIKKEEWIKIFSINLPPQHSVNNGFSARVIPGNLANPLFYKYCRLLCPAIPDIKVRITVSAK